ncbi:hypothetical protein [Streptomyces sp. NPDC002644]
MQSWNPDLDEGVIDGCCVVATGTFIHDGDDWKICDNYSDGHRAVIKVSYTNASNTRVSYEKHQAQGAGICVTSGVGVDIPEGTQVRIDVWHQAGENGTPQDVFWGYGTA